MKRFFALMAFGLAAWVLLTPVAALAGFGIDPGKVFVDNLFPGAEADYKITVYNQNDYETTFAVKVREPDYTETDYEPLPYPDWVTVTPDLVTIGAMEQSEVLVVVRMPEDAVYSGKKAETWISFMEQETEGMVKIDIASRLLISTRVEVPEETPAENPEEAPVEVPEEAPDENPEEAPAEVPEEAPSVQGNGAVGITAEPGGAETVSPEVEPGFPWAILGSVLGVVLVGGAVFFLVRRKRQQA